MMDNENDKLELLTAYPTVAMEKKFRRFNPKYVQTDESYTTGSIYNLVMIHKQQLHGGG